MRIALCTPWDNQWIPGYVAAFDEKCVKVEVVNYNPAEWAGHPDAVTEADKDEGVVMRGMAEFDAILLMWTDPYALAVLRQLKRWGHKKPVFLWMRRYEFFESGVWQKIETDMVTRWIFVNSGMRECVRDHFKDKMPQAETIWNGIWGLDEVPWNPNRTGGQKVAMVCHVHPKKNLPLAAQVMAALPPEYELNVFGGVQDVATHLYLDRIFKAVKRKAMFWGQMPRSDMHKALRHCDYLLSTSISEGNPNNVIEAMAMGIKPVIHNWPGAKAQFPNGLVFDTVQDAVRIIREPFYRPDLYRVWVKTKYGPENYRRVVDMVLKEVVCRNQKPEPASV